MKPANPSIRRRLLVALISALLLVWLVAMLLVYRAAQHEVKEVFDANLARSARLLQTLLLHEVEEERELSLKVQTVVAEVGIGDLARYPGLAEIIRDLQQEDDQERLELVRTARDAGSAYESGLLIVVRYADGDIMLRDAAVPDLPLTEPGYSDVTLADHRWRVFRLTDPQTGLTVQVGEHHAFRDELVRYITRNTLMPLLVALPLLAVLIWIIVGQALQPLHRVAIAVSERAPDALEAIGEQTVPREVHSLVRALNTLFARLRAAFDRERQFTADAAHELRTPLAAMKTHLQVARSGSHDPDTRGSLDKALTGVDRATHTVDQLLLLARADAQRQQKLLAGQVNLQELAADGVASLSQLAVERNIDLGLETAAASEVPVTRGDRSALQILLRNLIDNAVRYTPMGGQVTVAVGRDDTGTWLRVSDNGPGIPAESREHMFRRFRRGAGEQAAGTSGSGLGLSIVQRIARLHDADVELGQGLDDAGLGVTVRFRPV